MSKGTPIHSFRFPPLLRAAVLRQIQSRNANSPRAPMTVSDFIIRAIEEKLAKMERSRSGKRTKPARA
jgi:hypothetical protein